MYLNVLENESYEEVEVVSWFLNMKAYDTEHDKRESEGLPPTYDRIERSMHHRRNLE